MGERGDINISMEFKEDDCLRELITTRNKILKKEEDEMITDERISDEDIERFENSCFQFVEGYKKCDKSIACEAAKDLYEGLDYFKKIPLINCIITNKIIELSADYCSRYSFSNDEEICNYTLNILYYLSFQSNDYTQHFKPIIKKLFAFIKFYTGNVRQRMVVDILSNCMDDESLVSEFDEIPIVDFNENYAAEITTLDECQSVMRFYSCYLREKAPIDIYQSILYQIPNILRKSDGDHDVFKLGVEILSSIAENHAIDMEFIEKEDLISFMAERVEEEDCAQLAIYFFSFCTCDIESFISINPFPPQRLIEMIAEPESSQKWDRRAITVVHFLAVLTKKKLLDEEQMLFCAKWICDGVEEASFHLKQSMLTLMCSIISVCGKDFIDNANLKEMFDFLNDSISANCNKVILIYACDSMINFAANAEKLAIDIKPPVIESGFLNTLSSLIEECEANDPIFDLYKETFNN